MEKKTERAPRFRLAGADRVILIVLAALLGLMVILGLLTRLGLNLIKGEVYILLPIALVLGLLGWGAYALFRRIRSGAVKFAVGALLTLVMFALLMLAMSYGSFVANLTIPQRYVELRSPSGKHTLVVLRVLDGDEARASQRQAARIEADPESDPAQIAEDWGFLYAAYPKTLGIFYRSDADVEGEVYMGFTSKAELMAEWLEEESVAHFYVKDPGPGDGGEITLHIK